MDPETLPHSILGILILYSYYDSTISKLPTVTTCDVKRQEVSQSCKNSFKDF